MEKSDLPPDADSVARLASVQDAVSNPENILGRIQVILSISRSRTGPMLLSLFALFIIVVIALKMMLAEWRSLPSDPEPLSASMVLCCWPTPILFHQDC
jgi:hypothetical protein